MKIELYKRYKKLELKLQESTSDRDNTISVFITLLLVTVTRELKFLKPLLFFVAIGVVIRIWSTWINSNKLDKELGNFQTGFWYYEGLVEKAILSFILIIFTFIYSFFVK